jgi:hypothetical protein
MSLIVAARFTTFPGAEDAAQKLFNAGFVEEDVTLFFVNPRGQHARHHAVSDLHAAAAPQSAGKSTHTAVTLGAVAGAVVGVGIFAAFSAPILISLIAAGVGAYIGSMVGAMLRTSQGGHGSHHVPFYEETRASGVLVAVHVSPDNQFDAARVLREAGGAAIERASGRWQQGRWADFDPLKNPEPMGEFTERHA